MHEVGIFMLSGVRNDKINVGALPGEGASHVKTGYAETSTIMRW